MSVSTETRTMLEQDFFEHHPEARRKAAPVEGATLPTTTAQPEITTLNPDNPQYSAAPGKEVMKIEILKQDIEGAGHGNSDDPLVRALERTQGGEWRSETHSQGMMLRRGQAWSLDLTHQFEIDEATTRALHEFDASKKMEPRVAELREIA